MVLFVFLSYWRIYLLIAAVIAEIFSLYAKLVIPIRISTIEANAEIKIHPVIEEPKVRRCSI